jgi:hypothetical protein
LFGEVVASDARQYFAAFAMRSEEVVELVGDIFDPARSRPEHLRMPTRARLEGPPWIRRI